MNCASYSSSQFIFKYPNTWTIDSSESNKLVITRPTNQKMDLEFVPGWGSITISKTNDSVETMIKETSGLDKKEEIIFDGKSAFKLSGSSGIASSVQFINIVTDHQNITYIISLTSQDDQLFPVFTSEFDQILSTFKFVGQNN